ncbi:MAG: SDR family NAD(P)-dependent oxidoreductase [Acidimicrobiia bacterium]
MEGEPLLSGKTCVVTGASSGIGRATAGQLVALGARVILVCRQSSRGEEAAAHMNAQGWPGSTALLTADLASQAQVRRLADDLSGEERLDVLVHNAGVYQPRRTLSEDGIETTLAVNHLAPFLLTHLLLDTLRRSRPSRVVTLASIAAEHGRIRFDDLGGERRYLGLRAYCQSKLANVVFTAELARRLEETDVDANCVHPGFVRTGLGRQSLTGRAFFTVFGSRMLTPEQGAATTVHVSSAPGLAGVSGKFFTGLASAREAASAADASVAGRLWEVSARLTGVG